MSEIARYSVALITGIVTVLPFIVLEWVSTNAYSRQGFPLTLFLGMAVMAGAITLAAISVRFDIRDKTFLAKPAPFIFKVATILVLSWAWIHLVMDQMRCFLGANGC